MPIFPSLPPEPEAVDAIVTCPDEPVTNVIFDPALRYALPSLSFVSEPVIEVEIMFPIVILLVVVFPLSVIWSKVEAVEMPVRFEPSPKKADAEIFAEAEIPATESVAVDVEPLAVTLWSVSVSAKKLAVLASATAPVTLEPNT